MRAQFSSPSGPQKHVEVCAGRRLEGGVKVDPSCLLEWKSLTVVDITCDTLLLQSEDTL